MRLSYFALLIANYELVDNFILMVLNYKFRHGILQAILFAISSPPKSIIKINFYQNYG